MNDTKLDNMLQGMAKLRESQVQKDLQRFETDPATVNNATLKFHTEIPPKL
ncbi:hypothetical protein P0082_00325 [Candidatus Haliotispira prima]|uniref:Uncharacterized protein n=1 Tax=Candidatus Haliotispira prima TaxID=3034016 RepID=A0ABY8MH43_9SPIO|nr:hypothetical protein P0082_00325 [Candidatus Haliotispira prima]